jgi:hypothetical protein
MFKKWDIFNRTDKNDNEPVWSCELELLTNINYNSLNKLSFLEKIKFLINLKIKSY